MNAEEMRKTISYIVSTLHLSLHPQAVKMLEDESSVPENVLRPMRDKGEHMALCQALALTKREGRSVWFCKQDHWCWNPLIGLGHVACEPGMPAFEEVAKNLGISDMNQAREFFAVFPPPPSLRISYLTLSSSTATTIISFAASSGASRIRPEKCSARILTR